MTKLPDDVVREILKSANNMNVQDAVQGLRHCYKIGAEFGYQLSQAKAMKLVEALDKLHDACRIADFNEELPFEIDGTLLDEASEVLATFKQQTTPREDEK